MELLSSDGGEKLYNVRSYSDSFHFKWLTTSHTCTSDKQLEHFLHWKCLAKLAKEISNERLNKESCPALPEVTTPKNKYNSCSEGRLEAKTIQKLLPQKSRQFFLKLATLIHDNLEKYCNISGTDFIQTIVIISDR
ncbi:nuclear transcription factor Y subunit B [Trichinella spiralis]|uniref:nuclear transcription factor Y subunit B n=1 Tax=Trichinella spiralis TaxID=6334 RepID=UPI0001EFB834|nr:nuclear transcription factor Y subunit B [Trichinella spiralis]